MSEQDATQGSTPSVQSDRERKPSTATFRKPRPDDKSIPREAKISFGIGIAILVFLISIPIVGIIFKLISKPERPAPPPPPPPSVAPSGPTTTGLPPRGSQGSTSSGGGGGGGGADIPDDPNQLPRKTYQVFSGLKAFFSSAGQVRNVEQIPDVNGFLPAGNADSNPQLAETFRTMADRVRGQPIAMLRVLGETPTQDGTIYDFELVSHDKDGTELVARARVMLAEDEEGTVKISSLNYRDDLAFDVPTPFIPRTVGSSTTGQGGVQENLPQPLGSTAQPAPVEQRNVQFPVAVY